VEDILQDVEGAARNERKRYSSLISFLLAALLVAAQCSGTLVLAKLGLLKGMPACTDSTSKSWVEDAGVEVLEQPFYARGNVATV